MSTADEKTAVAAAATNETAVTSAKKLCPVCQAPGPKVCAGCSKVGYCTKEHQREHWPTHKKTCEQKHKQTETSKGAADGVTVTWDDQKNINRFSRLNAKISSLSDEIKSIHTDSQNVNDALTDVESLIDDDACCIKVGEVFLSVDNDSAESYVKSEATRVSALKAEKENERSNIESEMATLKRTLYAKFGKTINLENADQTIND
jgi:prefoldin subunit 4